MFKKSFKKVVAMIALVLLLSALTGCGDGVKVGEFFSDEKTEKDYKISIAAEKVRTLNPVASFDATTINISKLVYSGLFKFNDALIPEPDLAEGYTYSDDKRTLEITLRSDVTWHDGEQLTAEDVKFTIDTIKLLASYNETPYSSYVANIRTVKTDADNKVTISFGSDSSIGLENFTFPVLPSHLYSSTSKVRSDVSGFIPVGTGMYRLGSYDEIEQIVLVPNENYYGNIAENTISFEFIPEISSGLNLMENGNLTLIFMNDYDRETSITNKNVKITSYPSNITEILGFNTIGIFTSDKNFRQAIAYLVNNEELIENVYYRNGYLTDSIIYPGYYGIENFGDLYPYDKETAEKLLEKAGCIDRDEDGYRENKDNIDIELRFLVNESDSLRVKAAGEIKKSIEKSGISVITDYCTGDEYSYKLASGEFDIFLGSCAVGERGDLRSILHSQYGNPAKYSNEMTDELVTSMLSETNTLEKINTVSRLKGILADDLPYYPLLNKTYGVVSSLDFAGEFQPMFNNTLQNCGNWYTEKII